MDGQAKFYSVTSLISWIGVDQRGPASVYIASDSRITWGNGETWDHGRKTFVARNSPQLLAYCGNVVFPSQVLGQLTSVIDSGRGFPADDDAHTRLDYIESILTVAMRSYPLRERRDFSIVYASRLLDGMSASFDVHALHWSQEAHWSRFTPAIPTNSDVVLALGSGDDEGAIQDSIFEWNQTEARDTSRAVFGAFCDAIRLNRDPRSGGPAQLVGLYRIGPPREFAIVWNNKLYLNGLNVLPAQVSVDLECRNETFERCSPATLRPFDDAQRQPRPSRLSAP